MAMLFSLSICDAWGATATIEFTDRYNSNTKLDGTAISIADGITATFAKRSGGTDTQYYTNGTAVRWYSGGSLKIASSVGNITAITITYTQTANSVTSNPAGYTLYNKTGKWAGDAASITFTQSGTSGHCRIATIEVTYTTSSSSESKVSLTDEQFSWNTKNAEATMPSTFENKPVLTNSLDLDVTYTSSNTNVATIDEDGNVAIVAAGTTTISAFYKGGDDAGEGKVYAAKTVSYTLAVKPAPLVIEPIEGGIIDVLTHDCLEATGSAYTSFTGKQAKNENHSAAVYAGNTARNGNGTQYNIQLNKLSDGRQIATTTTGGFAKRVYVKWATQTENTNARTLSIYGKNEPYSGTETTATGTEIGTITYETAAVEAYVDLTGDYKYINITASGAIYMDEIQVTWVSAEAVVATPSIIGDVEFVESTEVSISAEDGLKVYYTLDGTDPTNASTEYTAPFELTATTTVKAVAYDGENASDIISKTFKQLQVLTCEEAAELCAATESADKYVIRGYVTNIATAWSDQYSNISFWMADTKDGGKVFEAFRVQPIIAAEKSVKVGDYVEVIGKIVLYGTTPETSAGGTYTIIPAPVVNHTITVSANPAEAGTVTGGGEFEETDEITVKAVANEGYEFVNWTEGETVVSTEANYSFAVLADRNLVANFVEAAPEINYEEFIMSNLVVTTPAEGLEMLEASDPVNGISVQLGVYEDGTLHEDCLITFQGMELSIVSSEKVTKEYNEDVETDVYTVRVVVAFGGANMGLQLLMYATAPAEPIEVNVTNATATVGDDGWLTLNGTWNELPVMAKVAGYDEEAEEKVYEASYVGEFEYGVWEETESDFGFADQVTVTKKGDVITLEATFTSLNSGNVYNVTITTGAKISTAVDNVEATVAPVKAIENGQLIVIKNGVKYNAQGQVIK